MRGSHLRLALAAVLVLPNVAQATGVHTRADWFAGCGFEFAGNSVDGTHFAQETLSYQPVSNPFVLQSGASFADLNDPGAPEIGYQGTIWYTQASPLGEACFLSAGAIGTLAYDVADASDPGSSSIELTARFSLDGFMQGQLSANDSLSFGFNVYLADESDPLDGPRTTIADYFCDTTGCGGFGVDGSNLMITNTSLNEFSVSGTADVDFSVPEGVAHLGFVSFGSIDLGQGTSGPIQLVNDFGNTVSWTLFGGPDVSVVPTTPPIPEPGTAALLSLGLVALALQRRR